VTTPGAEFVGGEPGESELIARSFENAPPLIPHSVEDLLPITKDSNACLDCHLPDVAEDMGATSVPASHLYDIRHGQTLQGLSGANFNCSQCHAPQSDAATLMDNTFEPDFRDEEGKSSSNLLETLNEGVK
jgi:cytochrome c-type protein NapB